MTTNSPQPAGSLPAFALALLATLLAGIGISVERPGRPSTAASLSVNPVTTAPPASHSGLAGQFRESETDRDANEGFGGRDGEARPTAKYASEPPAEENKAKRQDVPQSLADRGMYSGDNRKLNDAFISSQGAPQGAREERSRSMDELSAFEQGAQASADTGQPWFYPRSGYWANTHIPGDPAIRMLHARLRGWDRSRLLGSGETPALEEAVHPVAQPFDAPASHALALNLLAEHEKIEADDSLQLVTLQVGIRAAEHRRGERPAMNLAVVLDIPQDAPDQRWIEARALVDALMETKRPGDRFALLLTHPRHGLVIPPEEFRFGTIQNLRKRLLGEEHAGHGEPLLLPRALAVAGDLLSVDETAGGAEPPMGTRSTLLITASKLGRIDDLTATIHGHALEGVHLSAVPLGDEPDIDDVNRLVLAGLGHRRILESPAQARALMQEELYAASRAVARAARLTISLAPGVEFLGIPGSHPLDENQTQRTRDIEQAMDLKLSHQLGIRSDRGQDDAGIQIVIPTIDSGDEVVILLRLAVAGPGPLADVSLRYKDLVHLRNARLRSSFFLEGNEASARPVSMVVQKNRLSRAFSESALAAGEVLGQGRVGEARQILADHLGQLRSAKLKTPAWVRDSDLQNDENVLTQYLAVLERVSRESPGPEVIGMLSDSLRLAAWAKTHQPLEKSSQAY